MNTRMALRVLILVVLAFTALPVPAATTTTVVDLPVGGVNVRFLYVRPDTPVATIVNLAGGSGFLGIQDDGTMQTVESRCGPVLRNRDAFAAHGYAQAFVNDASTTTLAKLQAVIDYVREQADVPVWLIGGSSAAPTSADLAVRLPA